MNNCKFDVV